MPRREPSRDRAEADARILALQAFLATRTLRPTIMALALRFHVGYKVVLGDLAELEARGVTLPPPEPKLGRATQCVVCPGLSDQGQRGWVVRIRGDVGRPERPPRFRLWCADVDEALAIQDAVKAGRTIDEAIHERYGA